MAYSLALAWGGFHSKRNSFSSLTGATAAEAKSAPSRSVALTLASERVAVLSWRGPRVQAIWTAKSANRSQVFRITMRALPQIGELGTRARAKYLHATGVNGAQLERRGLQVRIDGTLRASLGSRRLRSLIESKSRSTDTRILIREFCITATCNASRTMRLGCDSRRLQASSMSPAVTGSTSDIIPAAERAA